MEDNFQSKEGAFILHDYKKPLCGGGWGKQMDTEIF